MGSSSKMIGASYGGMKTSSQCCAKYVGETKVLPIDEETAVNKELGW